MRARSRRTPTFFSLIAYPVGVFILVVFLNAPLRKWLPRAALTQADLIVIFSLLSVTAAMASEYTFISHATIHQYPLEKETSKTARELILPNMPDWLIIKDKALVEDIQGGGHGFWYVWASSPSTSPNTSPGSPSCR